MRIDPGMHIGLHLVFLGKTGVTELDPTGLEDRILASLLESHG
jgi:hypothetical protein